MTKRLTDRANIKDVAEMLGTLLDLASYRDIDTSAAVTLQLAHVLGIDPSLIPNYEEISTF